MDLSFLTREVFDVLVFVVILVGGALAAVRLYADYQRYRRAQERAAQSGSPASSPIDPVFSETQESENL